MVILLAVGLWTARVSFADTRFLTTPYQQIVLYKGPGTTYLQLAKIQAGVPLTIIERNSVGTWVHVQQARNVGTTIINDGWVISGYLNFDLDFHFGDVPVNTTLPDADADSDMSQLHDLYLVPVIPTISDAMRAVYQHGHDDLRNYSYVITKVGDSMTADDLYLKPMSRDDNVLRPYDYLGDAVSYFGASTSVDSVAARVGMTTYTVFDPTWADKSVCHPRETPLDCEYRRKRPSIALIMFGVNDLKRMDDVHFDQQMRKIVDDSIQHGVIPVLSTFSYDPAQPLWLQSVLFNRRLVKIAADEQVPIINLWLAARSLPYYGLEDDDIHMKHWGFGYLKFDHGSAAYSGAALRNLLSIRTLDEIRRTVILNAQNSPASAATPEITQPATPEITASP